MPDFEDSSAGATDISGAPTASGRSPRNLPGSGAGRQQGGASQKPKSSGAQSPLQGLGDAVGGAMQGAGDWLKGQGDQQKQQDKGLIDWAKEYERDASSVWGMARQGYKIMSDTYHDGVANLYGRQDAQARYMQMGVSAAVSGAVPFLGMKEAGQEALNDVQGIASGDQAGTDQKNQQAQAQEVHDAPGAAADIGSMVLPGGAAGKAAMVGLPLAESLLGGQDDPNTSLAWAGVGMMLTFGHIPGPVKKALESTFQDWPVFEKLLQKQITRQTEVNRASASGTNKHVTDWIAEQLSRGASMTAQYGKPVAKALKPGEGKRVPAEITAEGAIKLLPSEARKGVEKLLNRAGVESVDELVHKAQTEGISDPKVIKGIQTHWKELGLPYDLRRFHPEEMPLRDPRRHIENLGDQKAGLQHAAAIHHYIDQTYRGLFANHSDPMTAVLRALAGHNRSTQWVHQQYVTSMVNLLGEGGLTEQAQERLMRAAEGDQAVYDALRPEEQMVVDGWGHLRSAAREQAKDTDHAKDFVPNWVPRTDKVPEEMARGRGRPSRASILATEAKRHRAEAVTTDPGGNLVLGQRFSNVSQANVALKAARTELVAKLLSESKLGAELENDPEAKAIRELAQTNPEEAAARANTLAMQKYADKETHFLKNVNRVFANQVRAIHTHQALNEFTSMLASDGRKAALKAVSTRQREEFIRQGYQTINDPRFSGFVFHPDLAENLSRYINHVKDPKTMYGKAWKTALQLEGKAVAAIMFSPVVHGLNMAGRMGMAGMMNPMEMAHYLKNGKALLPHQWDEQSWQLRSDAYNAGVLPHNNNHGYADSLLSKMHDAMGDMEEPMPKAAESPTRANRMKQLIGNVPRPDIKVNNYFWGAVNDFGVMMYHLEKTAAEKGGMATEAATEYAARRANSWMGMVAPEDTNPMLHDLSRLVMFAPNWWRTWAELMVPAYKRAGFSQDPVFLRHAAYQGAKTAMVALAFQKLTGNAVNYALSGHLQNENHPGNQDKVEISRPEILSALKGLGVLPPGIDPNTGEDPKTGGRYTIENPLARQQQAMEQAAGLESGHADYKPEDTWDGLTRFVASRFSPVLNSMSGAMNVDLYRSIHDGQMRALDPMERAGSISPASLLYGSIMLVPGGQRFAQNVNQNAAKGDTSPVESALGTHVPKSLQEALKDTGDPAAQTMFSWLTGTNPAYESNVKSRGETPSDQDYQRVKDLNSQYQQRMQILNSEAMSGQMTPAQWLKAYQDESRTHAAQMEALYKGSPEYVNGAQGMASQWEGLYQQATKSDGTLDQERLALLQSKFQQDHSSEQVQQMNLLLHQNDTKYPMLALYHKSQGDFLKWQGDWATAHGIDVSALRKQTAEYGQLYGDTRGQRQYLAQHRELSTYERDKKRQWDSTTQGVMHSLFYGNSAAVMRYLRAHHMTQSDLAAQEAQAAA